MPVQEPAHIDSLQRSLGRRIRELRSKHGWTQEEFAEFCGLHRTYMGHVERGEKNVSLSTVLRVANALGVRIPALFGGGRGVCPQTPVPAKPIAGRVRLNRPDVNRLLDELESQRKALRQTVRDLSRFLVRFADSTSYCDRSLPSGL